MTVRTHRLGYGLGGTVGTPMVIATCPADSVMIVKSLRSFWAAGAGVTWDVHVAAGDVIYVVNQFGATADVLGSEGLFIVLEEGDELRVNVNATNAAHRFYASGAILAL